MGREKEFRQVKLFSGVIFREMEFWKKAKKRLEAEFSTVDMESEPIPFDLTAYYHEEMGEPLFRRFLSFGSPIMPTELSAIKIVSNQIEGEFSHKGKRRVNIDPGYLSEGNVVIATTKNYYHRIPLQNGIYAHMEYIIRKKEIIPLEWTYPDFKKPEYLRFFNQLRIRFQKG